MTVPSSPPRAMVGFGDALAAIESVRSLLRAGYAVTVLARSGHRPPSGLLQGVDVVTVTPPEQSLAECVHQVGQLLASGTIDVVLPIDDSAVLVLDTCSTPAGVAIAGPRGSRAVLGLDKVRQLALADAAGLAVLPTEVVEPGQLDWGLPGPGPWIVRPAEALEVVAGRLTKHPTVTATSADRLHRAVGERVDRVIIQPWTPGVGGGVFGLGDHGVARYLSAHTRVRMMNPSGSGSSACRSAELEESLSYRVQRFVAAADWTGLFMVELLHAGDTAYFVELNPRAWGSMALASARGLEYAAWAADQALGRPLPGEPAPGPHVRARHAGRELLHLAFVARGRHELAVDVRRGRTPAPDLATYPTFPRALRDVMTWQRGDRLYNLHRGTVRAWAADVAGTVLAAPRRALRSP